MPFSRKPDSFYSKPKTGRIRRAPKEERTVDGVTFDSKAEMNRWLELKMLERAGEISNLVRQHQFVLAFEGRPVKIRSKGYPNGRICQYHADFTYFDKAGKLIVEEVKGVDQEADRLRRAVVEALYGIEILVTGAASKGGVLPGKAAA